MTISLRNAMKLGKFRECKVIAGNKGLDKQIENITIMEVPDIINWLKGRELIITSLFAIKDDKDAQNLLIQRLFYAGATALAIKPFHTMEKIPDNIINNANKLDFPVIQIPEHIKYLDILSPVMNQIFDEKVVLQENVEQVTGVLQEISLSSQGVDVFVETVSQITKNIVTIESELPFIQTPSPEKPISPLSKSQKRELAIIKRPIRYKRQYGSEWASCIVAPIIIDNEYYGNITCWAVKNNHLTIDLAVLEKASSLLSLEFLRLKVRQDVEQQYKNDFMRELLFNERINEKDLVDWGKKYSIKLNKKYVCMLLDEKSSAPFKTSEKKLDKLQINSILEGDFPNILIGSIRDWICIILPVTDSCLRTLCAKIVNKIYNYNSIEFNTGIGEIGIGPLGIRKSFFQAEQVIYLTETMSKRKASIMYYEDLGSFRLLGHLVGNKALVEFYRDTLGKLTEKNENKELVYTLKSFFNCNESLKDTAEFLFIHVNTLKYRLKRIEDITGHDLKVTEEKMNLFLGLKIFELLNYEYYDFLTND